MPKESEPGSPDQLVAPQRSGMQHSIPWLWAILIILLLLNIGLMIGLNMARLAAIEAVNQIETMLDNLGHEVVVYEVSINQAIPIQAEVPFNQTMDIPLDTVVALSQTLIIPFSGVDIELPVQTEVPVKTIVPVTLDEVIAVDTTVQLNTTIPVEIEVARTQLLAYLNQVKYELARLKSRLSFSAAPPPPPPPLPSPPTLAARPSPQQRPSLEPTATKLPSPTQPLKTTPPVTTTMIDPPTTLSPTAVSEETATPLPEASPTEALPPVNKANSPLALVSPPAEVVDPAPIQSPAAPEPQALPLVTYFASVEILGQQISNKAEPFQETALRYWANQATLEQFETAFNQFRPEVKEVIKQINQISPPEEATIIHQRLIDGLAKCNLGLDMLATWLETFDESLELPASLQVALCIEEVTTAESDLRLLLLQSE